MLSSKVSQSRLPPFGLQFNAISLILLLFILVHVVANVICHLLSISSTGSTFSSSKISSFLVRSNRVYLTVILQNVISSDVNRILSFVRWSKLRGQANIITWIH